MEPSVDEEGLEIWKLVEHEAMNPKDKFMTSQSPSLKKSITLPAGRGKKGMMASQIV